MIMGNVYAFVKGDTWVYYEDYSGEQFHHKKYVLDSLQLIKDEIEAAQVHIIDTLFFNDSIIITEQDSTFVCPKQTNTPLNFQNILFFCPTIDGISYDSAFEKYSINGNVELVKHYSIDVSDHYYGEYYYSDNIGLLQFNTWIRTFRVPYIKAYLVQFNSKDITFDTVNNKDRRNVPCNRTNTGNCDYYNLQGKLIRDTDWYAKKTGVKIFRNRTSKKSFVLIRIP